MSLVLHFHSHWSVLQPLTLSAWSSLVIVVDAWPLLLFPGGCFAAVWFIGGCFTVVSYASSWVVFAVQSDLALSPLWMLRRSGYLRFYLGGCLAARWFVGGCFAAVWFVGGCFCRHCCWTVFYVDDHCDVLLQAYL